MTEQLNTIAEIIEDVADIPVDEIELNSSLIDDLDLSSIEIMSVISKIESDYSIKISEKQILGIDTVADLLSVIAA